MESVRLDKIKVNIKGSENVGKAIQLQAFSQNNVPKEDDHLLEEANIFLDNSNGNQATKSSKPFVHRPQSLIQSKSSVFNKDLHTSCGARSLTNIKRVLVSNQSYRTITAEPSDPYNTKKTQKENRVENVNSSALVLREICSIAEKMTSDKRIIFQTSSLLLYLEDYSEVLRNVKQLFQNHLLYKVSLKQQASLIEDYDAAMKFKKEQIALENLVAKCEDLIGKLSKGIALENALLNAKEALEPFVTEYRFQIGFVQLQKKQNQRLKDLLFFIGECEKCGDQNGTLYYQNALEEERKKCTEELEQISREQFKSSLEISTTIHRRRVSLPENIQTASAKYKEMNKEDSFPVCVLHSHISSGQMISSNEKEISIIKGDRCRAIPDTKFRDWIKVETNSGVLGMVPIASLSMCIQDIR